jgi:vancomycin resistance protein VanW
VPVPPPTSRRLPVLHRLLPLGVRVALRRAPHVFLHSLRPAPARAGRNRASHPHVQCAHASPLARPGAPYPAAQQRAKEQNVARAVSLLDGAILLPGESFSFHRHVGPPLRLRGFADGPELHQGALSTGVGGGVCQVANLLYWLAAHAGLTITERHRHELDLFPDHDRTAPFGCGATVFYPLKDLRFRNPHPVPVLLELAIDGGMLAGCVRLPADPGVRWDVAERGHRFVQRGADVWRENRLLRRRLDPTGIVLGEEPLSENRARVLYPVPAHLAEHDLEDEP